MPGIYRPWFRPPQTTINIYQQSRMMPHCHHGGSGGFWGAFGGGFVGGLLASFSRMPMMGGFFGGMPMIGGMPMMGMTSMPMMNMSGMPTMGGMPTMNMLGNTQQTEEKDQFSQLRNLFPEYTFEEIDGKYYAKDGEGKVTEYNTFDAMMDALVNKNASTDPNAEEIAQIRAEAAQEAAVRELKEELDAFLEDYKEKAQLPEGVSVTLVNDPEDENNLKFKIQKGEENPAYFETITDLGDALAAMAPASKKTDGTVDGNKGNATLQTVTLTDEQNAELAAKNEELNQIKNVPNGYKVEVIKEPGDNFGKFKVTDPKGEISIHDCAEAVKTYLNMQPGGITTLNTNANKQQWSVKEESGMFTRDAVLTDVYGNEYKLRTNDGDDLNIGKFDLGNGVRINKDYLDEAKDGYLDDNIYIINSNGDKKIPAKVDPETGEITVQIDYDHKPQSIEDFLSGVKPIEYTEKQKIENWNEKNQQAIITKKGNTFTTTINNTTLIAYSLQDLKKQITEATFGVQLPQ